MLMRAVRAVEDFFEKLRGMKLQIKKSRAGKNQITAVCTSSSVP